MDKTILPSALCILGLLAVCHVHNVSPITMTSQGQVYVVNHGQALELQCEFLTDEYDLFDNPVFWKKHQRQEEAQINIMGNIFEPFLATNRFEVLFGPNAPRYSLTLRIANMTSEDSGNYTCEVRGRKSTVLTSVTHFVFVRATVRFVYLTADNYTQTTTGAPSDVLHTKRVVFIEDTPKRLRCVSVGGYPTPEILLYLGNRDITAYFSMSYTATMHGKLGLRLMMYQTERYTDRLALGAANDGDKLRCVVTVPGLTPNVTEAIVEVNYGPIMTCTPTSAHVGERNVRLGCEIRSRPGVTSLFWIIDVNGTTVSDGEVINEYWSLVMDRSDGVMETQLYMKQAGPNSFRTYTLVAENSIATSTQQVYLLNKVVHATTHSATQRNFVALNSRRDRTSKTPFDVQAYHIPQELNRTTRIAAHYHNLIVIVISLNFILSTWSSVDWRRDA